MYAESLSLVPLMMSVSKHERNVSHECTYCGALLSVFTLLAPFPGPANAVIVTPTTLKADVVPNTGVVITPHLGAVCFQLCY